MRLQLALIGSGSSEASGTKQRPAADRSIAVVSGCAVSRFLQLLHGQRRVRLCSKGGDPATGVHRRPPVDGAADASFMLAAAGPPETRAKVPPLWVQLSPHPAIALPMASCRCATKAWRFDPPATVCVGDGRDAGGDRLVDPLVRRRPIGTEDRHPSMPWDQGPGRSAPRSPAHARRADVEHSTSKALAASMQAVRDRSK